MKNIKEAIEKAEQYINDPRTNIRNLNKNNMLEWNKRCMYLIQDFDDEMETAPLWILRNYYQLVAFINEIYEGLPDELD